MDNHTDRIEDLLRGLEAEIGDGATLLRSAGRVLLLTPGTSTYRTSFVAAWTEPGPVDGPAGAMHVASFEVSSATPEYEIVYRARMARDMLRDVARQPTYGPLRKDRIVAAIVPEFGDIPTPESAADRPSFTRAHCLNELERLRQGAEATGLYAEVLLLGAVASASARGGRRLLEFALQVDTARRGQEEADVRTVSR